MSQRSPNPQRGQNPQRPVKPRVLPVQAWVPRTVLVAVRALPFLGPLLLVAVAIGGPLEPPTAGARLEAYTPAIVGNGALMTLAGSMAVTPVRTLTGWTWHLPLRRYLGLWAFAFAVMEVVHTLALSGGAWIQGLFGQVFLAGGTLATIALVPLVVTSNRWSMRRLGRRWKSPHRLVYLALALIAVHLAFLPGAGAELLVFAGLFGPGLVVRVPVVRRAIVARRRAAALGPMGPG